jgi:integrative and conjugative element protein (TIGR02256 family)
MPIEVLVSKEALEFMKGLTQKTPGVETGGVLMGRIDEAGIISIETASGPGPNSTRSSTEFDRDIDYCQAFIDDHVRKGLRYVGEWHSHPNENNRPSSIDIKSLTEIAMDKNYLTTVPTMIIFTRSGEPSCTLHPHDGKFYFVQLRQM